MLIWTISFPVVFIVFYFIISRLDFQWIYDSSPKVYYDVEYINLPKELENLQDKMNHLKKENEKNERLARESEQKKNDLIVYLAHDLKTPLTSMIGYLSLLDEIKDMPKKQREKYVSVALNKSYRLEDLINELFEIANKLLMIFILF